MTSKEWSEHRFKIKLSVKPTQKYTICLFLRVSISHLGAIIFKTLGFYTSQISLFSHHGVPTWYFFSQKKNQIYLIDTKHKISAGLHYVSVRASINNIRRAEPGPHLLQGPGTCCGKLPRVSSDQWPGDRGGRGWVHNLDLVTHRGADSVHHRDQQGPGVGPRLPGVAHRKYKHHSRVRAETATRENITGVWTLNTVNTLSRPASNNDNGQLFLSSSHELLVTEIEHGLICATEIETYCALLWMRMFTDT